MERNFFIFLFLDEKEVSWKSVGKYGWEFIKNCVTGIFGLLESGFGYFLGSRLCVCVCAGVCFTTVCACDSGCWLYPSVKAMVMVGWWGSMRKLVGWQWKSVVGQSGGC